MPRPEGRDPERIDFLSPGVDIAADPAGAVDQDNRRQPDQVVASVRGMKPCHRWFGNRPAIEDNPPTSSRR